HLLLALLDDRKVERTVRALGGDPKALRKALQDFLDTKATRLPEDVERRPQVTLAVDRVIQRSAVHALSAEVDVIEGPTLLIQILKEEEAFAAYLLSEQGITTFDLKQYVSHGITPDGDEDS